MAEKLVVLESVYSGRYLLASILSAAFGLFTLLTLVALGRMPTRGILRPIEQLTEFSRACADGKETTLELRRDDELGVLADILQGMVRVLTRQSAFSDGLLCGIPIPCSVFSPEDATLFTSEQMMDLIERSGGFEDVVGLKSGAYIWGDPSRETISTRPCTKNALSRYRGKFPPTKATGATWPFLLRRSPIKTGVFSARFRCGLICPS